MASITIARDAGFADSLREYSILLDDLYQGELAQSGVRAFSIEPGQHRLEARLDWCASAPLTFTAAADDEVKFIVESNLRGPKVVVALLYLFVARKSYLRLRRVADFSGLKIGGAPVVLDRGPYILKHGVLGWGLTTGVLWSLFMYLWADHRPPLWLLITMLPMWLIGGAAWGAYMWRRFGEGIAKRRKA